MHTMRRVDIWPIETWFKWTVSSQPAQRGTKTYIPSAREQRHSKISIRRFSCRSFNFLLLIMALRLERMKSSMSGALSISLIVIWGKDPSSCWISLSFRLASRSFNLNPDFERSPRKCNRPSRPSHSSKASIMMNVSCWNPRHFSRIENSVCTVHEDLDSRNLDEI